MKLYVAKTRDAIHKDCVAYFTYFNGTHKTDILQKKKNQNYMLLCIGKISLKIVEILRGCKYRSYWEGEKTILLAGTSKKSRKYQRSFGQALRYLQS